MGKDPQPAAWRCWAAEIRRLRRDVDGLVKLRIGENLWQAGVDSKHSKVRDKEAVESFNENFNDNGDEVLDSCSDDAECVANASMPGYQNCASQHVTNKGSGNNVERRRQNVYMDVVNQEQNGLE